MSESFTLVFKGDLLQIRHDPLTMETPFGVPYSYGLGDFIVRHDVMRAALNEARLQIEYMQSKFEPTGSGNAVLSRIRAALDEVKS